MCAIYARANLRASAQQLRPGLLVVFSPCATEGRREYGLPPVWRREGGLHSIDYFLLSQPAATVHLFVGSLSQWTALKPPTALAHGHDGIRMNSFS